MAADDWPDPVERINEGGASGVVLLCEHASRHIPAEYDGLGLGEADRRRHIAWDIGAAGVTRRLAALLDAPAFLGTYSRLLIDLNRPLGVPTSIVERSEDTVVPGNLGLGAAERARRAERMFTPFHDAVAAHLDARAGRPTRLVTIHSFTPTFHGVPRPWHAGVLFAEAAPFAEALLAGLAGDGLFVAPNEPYTISREGDYAVPVHGDDRGIPAVLVEIRQDLVADERGEAEWAARIAGALATCP